MAANPESITPVCGYGFRARPFGAFRNDHIESQSDLMAAFGLYTHIQSNKRRSIALLIGLFFLIYLLVFAGALTADALLYDASLSFYLRQAWRDFLLAAPWATLGTIVWIFIGWHFHQWMIDKATD